MRRNAENVMNELIDMCKSKKFYNNENDELIFYLKKKSNTPISIHDWVVQLIDNDICSIRNYKHLTPKGYDYYFQIKLSDFGKALILTCSDNGQRFKKFRKEENGIR